MSSEFTIIAEEFGKETEAIRSLVEAFNDPHKSTPKARVAAANSATLLLAATFEEFIREMARTYAKAVVSATDSLAKLPRNFASVAWRRTLEKLARVPVEIQPKDRSAESEFSSTLSRFNTIYEFCRGDLSQDIFKDLIHNENNMRPNELNSLFKISGLGDVCFRVSDKSPLLDTFGETEPGKAHGRLIVSFEEFFERRNAIAHSLNPAQSSGSAQILRDIDLFNAFGRSLCETLEVAVPTSKQASSERVGIGENTTLKDGAASP